MVLNAYFPLYSHRLGVVFREKEDDEEEGQRYWDVYKYFRDFNYWNREEVPSERDHVQKWMEWPGISKIVSEKSS